MAEIYSIWHRAWDGTVWSDVTSYIQVNTIEFVDNVEGEPFTFSFNIHDRLKNTDTQLFVEDGDYIAVIDEAQGIIAENGKMLGRVDLDANIVGADWVNTSDKPFRWENDITVKEFDFSDNKLRDYPDENDAAALKGYENTSITTIIQDILLYSDERVGRQLDRYTGSNAIVSFWLNFTDYDVKSFKTTGKSTRQAFVELMRQERLFFKVRWYYETDVTNGIKVACSIEIFDRAGIAPFHPSWYEADSNGQTGVSDELIRVGKVNNSAYDGTDSQPRFYYCCKNIDVNTDKDIIRNYILIEAVVVENADAFNDDDNALSRYVEQVDHAKQFNYTLPFPALDIKYVGFLVRSRVTSETTPTTTTFSVPSFDAASFNYDAVSGKGDIVRVYDVSGNVQAFREVSNVSGNTITVSSALPFTPDVNDIVENVQPYWMTIYDDREVDNNSFGVVKELDQDKSQQEAKLRFLDLSEPPPPVELIVYYYKCFKYKDTPFNQASINRYGMRPYEAKLDGIFTKEQIREIAQKLLILEPNKTVDFISYRPSEAGMQIPVDITNFIDQTTLTASTVRGRFGGGQLEKNFLYTEYDVTLSELKEDIEDIMRRINNQYKSERSSGEDNERIVQEETIHVISYATSSNIPAVYSPTVLYSNNASGTYQIYNIDLVTDVITDLSNNIYNDYYPSGTPIANKVAYFTNEGVSPSTSYKVAVADYNGFALSNRTTFSGSYASNSPGWLQISPDGSLVIAYYTDTVNNLYVFDTATGTQNTIVGGNAWRSGRFTPDGKYFIVTNGSNPTPYRYYVNYSSKTLSDNVAMVLNSAGDVATIDIRSYDGVIRRGVIPTADQSLAVYSRSTSLGANRSIRKTDIGFYFSEVGFSANILDANIFQNSILALGEWNQALSPDRSEIAYIRDATSPPNLSLYKINTDGTGKTLLYDAGPAPVPPTSAPVARCCWREITGGTSASAEKIVFNVISGEAATPADTAINGIYWINPDGTGVTQLTFNGYTGKTSELAKDGYVSTDGTKITYVSDYNTTNDIYVASISISGQFSTTAGDTVRVTNYSSARWPVLSSDKNYVVFRDDAEDTKIHVVNLSTATLPTNATSTTTGHYVYDFGTGKEVISYYFDTEGDYLYIHVYDIGAGAYKYLTYRCTLTTGATPSLSTPVLVYDSTYASNINNEAPIQGQIDSTANDRYYASGHYGTSTSLYRRLKTFIGGLYMKSGSTETDIDNGAYDSYEPALSLDETELAYLSNETGTYNVYTQKVAGTDRTKKTTLSGSTAGLSWVEYEI